MLSKKRSKKGGVHRKKGAIGRGETTGGPCNVKPSTVFKVCLLLLAIGIPTALFYASQSILHKLPIAIAATATTPENVLQNPSTTQNRGALEQPGKNHTTIAAKHPIGEKATTAIQKPPTTPKGISVVSYSVYGPRPKYVAGMISTATLMPQYFPGWQVRVYHDHTVPHAEFQTLAEMPHVTLVNVTKDLPPCFATDVNPMAWRFLVAADPTVAAYLIRDSDSRPSGREKAAVDEWLRSGTAFHLMRDHQSHDPSSFAAILGGLWGGLHRAVPDMQQLITQHYCEPTDKPKVQYSEDQHFLWKYVLPRAQNDCLQHDSHHCVVSGGLAFPVSSEEAGDRVDDFVGSVENPFHPPPEYTRRDMYKNTPQYLNCLKRRRVFLADRRARNLSTTVLPCTPYIGNMVHPDDRKQEDAKR